MHFHFAQIQSISAGIPTAKFYFEKCVYIQVQNLTNNSSSCRAHCSMFQNKEKKNNAITVASWVNGVQLTLME